MEIIKQVTNVQIYEDPNSAFAEISGKDNELVIFDAVMPDIQVLEIAARLLRLHPKLLLVLVADSDHFALEAMQMGVLDYMVRPVTPERLGKLAKKLNRRLSTSHRIEAFG